MIEVLSNVIGGMADAIMIVWIWIFIWVAWQLRNI